MKTLITIHYAPQLTSGSEAEALTHKYVTNDTFSSKGSFHQADVSPLKRHIFSVMKDGIIILVQDGRGFTITPNTIQRIEFAEVGDDFELMGSGLVW